MTSIRFNRGQNKSNEIKMNHIASNEINKTRNNQAESVVTKKN